MNCPRCGGDTVLATLRLPHTWTNASGEPVRVLSDILLCAHCDATEPLVAAFTSAEPEELARHLLRWIAQARPPTPDETTLLAESEAWHHGTL